MNRTPVESSNVQAIAYELFSQTLEVEFKGGAVYRYRRVPLSEAQALYQAESKGAFVNSTIKDVYPFEKVQ